MYIRVHPKDIMLHTKYKIEGYDTAYIDTFSSIVCIHKELYLMISNTKVFTSLDCTFFNFVSDNPQWKMERRSVNMIVRRLIGDDNFEW